MTAAALARTALVTGASRGLGAAIARQLASDHHVYLGGRSTESLASIASELGTGTPWPVDLTDHDAVAAAVQPIESLDVLVHNAGIAALGTIEESSVEDWRRQYESNVLSVVALTQLLLPALRRAGGHVVLINSGAGIRANPGWGGYAASKFALRAFADALRQEEPSLRVTSVHPGRIDTDMQRAIVEHEGGEYDGSKFLQAGSVALAVRSAIDTPADTHPTEIVLRSR
ncbi:SDR family oxidoreductase [Rhodococcus sp. H36-A4]|uniref:SDR family oxidoreductase n=1 Tax=Rhodococcus sp. H36-A4 TaxID=3004353 RepID=UPI0022B01F6F|nr:SDR family oxidoreductase [Rhodococcus sp. H36-A4]MCZ4077519.1 SDR family oxidoreductase [Rhodococcus sp. H36-A4]